MQIRFLLLVLFFTSQVNLFSQALTKEYLNKNWNKTTVIDSAMYYHEGNQTIKGEWDGDVKTYDLTHRLVQIDYYKDGKLNKQTKYYSNGNVKSKHVRQQGITELVDKWYENGQKEEEGEENWDPNNITYKVYNFWDSTGKQTVVNGTGKLTRYAQGKPETHEIYKNGNLVKGIAYGENGKTYTYTSRHLMPEFPGGVQKMMQYLGKNIKYPYEALINNIQGKVVVGFVVGRDGKVKDIEVTSPRLGYGLEEEAIRVIAAMPSWRPAIQAGQIIPVRYSIPVNFNF